VAGTIWVNFYRGINRATVGASMSNLQTQMPTRPDKITILLSSEGGRTVDGLTAYNFLRALPCEIVTHNYGSSNQWLSSSSAQVAGERQHRTAVSQSMSCIGRSARMSPSQRPNYASISKASKPIGRTWVRSSQTHRAENPTK